MCGPLATRRAISPPAQPPRFTSASAAPPTFSPHAIPTSVSAFTASAAFAAPSAFSAALSPATPAARAAPPGDAPD